jgi:hypothetical protein
MWHQVPLPLKYVKGQSIEPREPRVLSQRDQVDQIEDIHIATLNKVTVEGEEGKRYMLGLRGKEGQLLGEVLLRDFNGVHLYDTCIQAVLGSNHSDRIYFCLDEKGKGVRAEVLRPTSKDGSSAEVYIIGSPKCKATFLDREVE